MLAERHAEPRAQHVERRLLGARPADAAARLARVQQQSFVGEQLERAARWRLRRRGTWRRRRRGAWRWRRRRRLEPLGRERGLERARHLRLRAGVARAHDGVDEGEEAELVTRGSLFAGVQVAGLGSLTYEYGFDDTQASRDDLRHHFHAGILNWYATKSIQIRATGGTQRGGLKCIAGVCRIFPSFAGGLVEVIGKYDLGG